MSIKKELFSRLAFWGFFFFFFKAVEILGAFKHESVNLKTRFEEDDSVTLYIMARNSKRLDTGMYAKLKGSGDGIKMSSVPFKAQKEESYVCHASFSQIKLLWYIQIITLYL